MRIAFITTVFNEENTIEDLLSSLEEQNLEPTEVVIADGGSRDKTVEKIIEFQKRTKLKIKLIEVKGNRSIGRNTAIKNTSSEIIACSDAGCVLDKNWLKEITFPFQNKQTDVVAGYYKGKARNIFQKCLIPYVLVMPDKVNSDIFLPATRSMAFRRSVWEKHKFDKDLSNNEDYEFARRIHKQGESITFTNKAIVYWTPPGNIQSAFIMFYRFAVGDAESDIFRPKVILLFIRYLIGIALLVLAILNESELLVLLLIAILELYAVWAIGKNYKYVKDERGFYILPFLQFLSDIAVLVGSIKGIINRWVIRKTR